MDQSIADLRKNYTLTGLTEAEANPNPFVQFRLWFNQALEAQFLEPNAMTIATVTPDGKPSARMVLLKDFDERGFVFYTNYDSAKGQQLAQTPWAALVFWWDALERQVRIEGTVEKVSQEESDAYFASRPWESRLGAWVSDQSRVIESREVLENRLQALKDKYQAQDVPRPPHWGGFRVMPEKIEFWQGRPNRLHDRLCYKWIEGEKWIIERLSP
ncbi:pyridoxamine 5'-phosphate oxidase [Gloeothece citriformis PCC 7424]|uniref:Pyridoxine/pyridoxamine 5'-phosphate oxidase n=1 Tax=Gloeothece citriformis (strain PCC 7424) TaxID=65393 RepID=PDXH_GLOC7|nr:pyridoxamine 5'-phosphate oxidase [Gloeothece citriformis]B7K9I2.1 RecName: Full=Pyridoxine/pyridoxamine 5'-phosphate oxidase; AltName: Full=PNP/PMP oxidase; Short=PNPOx; AltName: Full=Pyridoxal 5'-phosphate synthase [Gloeothece citriformis PCC 7424]ACK69950.1 pyridoxamine 5'-phosphate oxidase [Gloeothece citriformis PCC 7424]